MNLQLIKLKKDIETVIKSSEYFENQAMIQSKIILDNGAYLLDPNQKVDIHKLWSFIVDFAGKKWNKNSQSYDPVSWNELIEFLVKSEINDTKTNSGEI